MSQTFFSENRATYMIITKKKHDTDRQAIDDRTQNGAKKKKNSICIWGN